MNGLVNKIMMVAGLGLASSTALAESHAYINYQRSSTESHVFVEQSIDGEYGTFATNGTMNDADGNAQSVNAKQLWKGYGFSTELGMELMKFVQFTASHTFVNLRYKEDALQSLTGSRVNAGLRLSFLSPVGNLEAGGGFQGSRLDYQKQLENGSFYGSGFYYSLGVNYYLSSRISVDFQGKMAREHLDRSSGSSSVRSIDTDTTQMGFGFRIWL